MNNEVFTDPAIKAVVERNQRRIALLGAAFGSPRAAFGGRGRPHRPLVRVPDAEDVEVHVAVAAEFAKAGVSDSFGDDGRDFPHLSKGEQLEARNRVRRVVNAIAARALKEKRELTRVEAIAMDGLAEIIERVEEYIAIHDDPTAQAMLSSNDRSWRGADGSEVRVLANTDRFVDLPGDRPRSSFGFGEYVAAMVGGSTDPDIRASLSEGTDSAGGYTVPVHLLRQLIDRMRSKTVAIQAGAMTIPLQTMTTKLARLASDPAAAWRNEGAAIAESDPTFESVTFTARSLAVMVKVSREVLDDSLNINEALMQAFAGALAGELDRVALFGSGTAPEPRGVFNTTNVGSVSMGTNGAQLTSWDKVIDSVYELEIDNSDAPSAMVMHPRTRQTISKLKDTTNQPLVIPPALAPIPQLTTTAVPITQVQGSSGAVCSPIILGDFKQLYFGIRQDMRIDVVRELFAANHQYAFIAHLRADVALAHPESFCKLIGILP